MLKPYLPEVRRVCCGNPLIAQRGCAILQLNQMKNLTPKIGDVFLVPLMDGGFLIGQVIAFETRGIHCISCGLFNQLTTLELGRSVIPDESMLFSTLLVSHVHILKGKWPVVNNLPIRIANKHFPFEKELRKGGIGARIQSPGIVESFVDAFFCKKPWNMYGRTNLFDELLLDPSKKPKSLIYK